MQGEDSRRAPRFKVSLKVCITGIDEAEVPRKGDISASGMFLTLDREVGPIGSMQRLCLSTHDDVHKAIVLARIVRVAAVDDLWKGRSIAGVAFQFLFAEEPGSDAMRTTARPASESEAVTKLLRALMQQAVANDSVELGNVQGTLRTAAGPQEISVNDLSVRGMVIDTDRNVGRDEVIRVELPGSTPGVRAAFEGRVIDCVQVDGSTRARYRAIVRFGEPEHQTREHAADAAASLDEAFASLLDAFTSIRPSPPAGGSHFAGELSRISLISVLTLCQIERVNGVLVLEHDHTRVRAYLRDGELVDALIEGRDASAREALLEVVGWHGGNFHVVFEPVLRPDRLGESTTALLIDLARELDERRARVSA